MAKSLQEIEDYYVDQGLGGDILRQTIEKDRQYQKLLRERKKELQSQTKVSDEEADKYVLSTDTDYEILSKIHGIKKYSLSVPDKELVKFIQTQLELDWRAPIITKLDALLRKYSATDRKPKHE